MESAAGSRSSTCKIFMRCPAIGYHHRLTVIGGSRQEAVNIVISLVVVCRETEEGKEDSDFCVYICYQRKSLLM